jgi:hypothetical protein
LDLLLQAEAESEVCVECLIGKQKKPILFKVTRGGQEEGAKKAVRRRTCPSSCPPHVTSFTAFER